MRKYPKLTKVSVTNDFYVHLRMEVFNRLETAIFQSKDSFDALALEVFQLQAFQNPVYAEFLNHLNLNPETVTGPEQIPFLPVSIFKHRKVTTGLGKPARIFESSSTTGQNPSKHYLLSESIYDKSIITGFEQVFGKPENWFFIGLLPSYIERQNASLVYMVNQLMEAGKQDAKPFFLKNYQPLRHDIETADKPVFLIGVTFALLDFASRHPFQFPKNSVIIETGGMKGRSEELLRIEVQQRLSAAFEIPAIGSEYGMTELLSQAWSIKDGLFQAPPWMKISIRNPYDPTEQMASGRAGRICVTDLANLYSCSFIATDDLGIVYPDQSFEILGRLDHAELRGCNLMAL